MDNLAKAKSLNNKYINRELEKQEELLKKKREANLNAKQNKYRETMENLVRVTGEEPAKFILINPNDNEPIHLPPSHYSLKNQQPLEERIKEKMEKAKTLQPKRRGRGRPQTLPSLRYYRELEERKKNQPQLSDDIKQNDVEEGNTVDNITSSVVVSDVEEIDTGIDTRDSEMDVVESSPIDDKVQKLSRDMSDDVEVVMASTPKKRGRGRPKKTDSTNSKEMKKVSESQKLSHVEGGEKMLYNILPLLYSNKKKSASRNFNFLVTFFSGELTPQELSLLFYYKDELKLTHAEIMALEMLLNLQQSDNKKQYYKIMEQDFRNYKHNQNAQPATTASSLLEQKLENAQEAIFGEKNDY